MLERDSILKGKYRILDEIGHGGMSTVYKAVDIETNQILAVKDVDRIKNTNGQIVVEELSLKEGQLLMRLSDPHLPKIYDIIESDSSFILVMDYIEGESLDKVIQRTNGGQPEELVYDWGIQICRVLGYLHSQRPPIIYRDMKPANIIVQPDGDLVLIDFGTARRQRPVNETEIRSDTCLMGTEGFAAPEQFGGLGQSDARTDIYCLGATLYNLITGHSPQVEPKGIRSLKYWDPALESSPLNDIIEKCTQRSPYDRYQTAEDLMEDLVLAKHGKYKLVNGKTVKPSGWQLQFMKSTTSLANGLTGLLTRKSGNLDKEQKKSSASLAGKKTGQSQEAFAEQKADALTKQAATVKAASDEILVKEQAAADTVEHFETDVQAEYADDTSNLWKKLMLFSGIAAAVLLILCIILVAARATTGGIILLIFGIAAIALAVFGFVMYWKEQDWESV